MNQIQKLESRLKEIGFEIEANENVLQIVGFAGEMELDFGKFSHVLRVTIESDDPFSEGGRFLFQDCSLKVYFDEWDLQEAAKVIKFNIASILEENGIFQGMDFVIPADFSEVLVP